MRGLHINYAKTRLNEEFVMYKETKQHLYAIPKKTWGDVEHHGIKGQKWGVRNGPPYPLDSSKSTGKRLKETKGGVKKKDKKNDKYGGFREIHEVDPYEKNLSNNQELSNREIKNLVDNTDIEQDDNFLEATYIPSKGSPVFIYGMNTNRGNITESDIKKAATVVLANKQSIEKACKDTIIKDKDMTGWYEIFNKNLDLNMSKKEWADSLELRSCFVSDGKDDLYEFSLYEPENSKDLTMYHSIDIEAYINPKTKKVKIGHISVNG